MGTLEQKWGPNGDPKTEKGPHGDRVPQMGTHVGTVQRLGFWHQLPFDCEEGSFSASDLIFILKFNFLLFNLVFVEV